MTQSVPVWVGAPNSVNADNGIVKVLIRKSRQCLSVFSLIDVSTDVPELELLYGYHRSTYICACRSLSPCSGYITVAYKIKSHICRCFVVLCSEFGLNPIPPRIEIAAPPQS